MAEILINAEEVRSCVKYKSGKVCIWLDGVKEIREVPPHGELIERKKLLEHRIEVYGSNEEVCEDYVETYHILEAPVVLSASE